MYDPLDIKRERDSVTGMGLVGFPSAFEGESRVYIDGLWTATIALGRGKVKMVSSGCLWYIHEKTLKPEVGRKGMRYSRSRRNCAGS
jgi:hypothetical protein